ncbi:hypothetical protein ACFY2Q_18810 [Micromonospora sp. NPDC000316]|uniref:hypothetical protein n=1 Tax=Micromonospora sp. NPDC000316 TaxID=3364216 RepID=UPI0036AB3232
MLPTAVSSSTDASSQTPFGVLGVLALAFALANTALRIWAARRLRAGQTLPGPLRMLRLFVDHPKLFLGVLCAEIAVGVLLLVAAVVATDH